MNTLNTFVCFYSVGIDLLLVIILHVYLIHNDFIYLYWIHVSFFLWLLISTLLVNH